MAYNPMQTDQSGAILGQGIRRGVSSFAEGFEDLDDEQKQLLLGKLGLGGAFDTLTGFRNQAREGLAGAIGLGPSTLAEPAGGALDKGSALKAGAQSAAKGFAKKALGTL